MAIDPWPIGVNQNMTIDGAGETTPDGRISSPTETGPGKVRRRMSNQVRRLRGRQEMTYAEVAAFDTFVQTTLRGGSLPFTRLHPRTGATVTCRFAVGGTLPQYSPITPFKWSVSLDLEILF